MKGIDGAELQHMGMIPPELMNSGTSRALASLYGQLGPLANDGLGKAIIDYTRNVGLGGNKTSEVIQVRSTLERAVMRPMNKRAARVRDVERSMRDPEWLQDT